MSYKNWFVNSYNVISVDDRVNKLFEDRFWLASLYHENSKYYPDIFSKQMPLMPYSVPLYDYEKTYPVVCKVPSFKELYNSENEFIDSLFGRRSSWEFSGGTMGREKFHQLLQFSAGTTEKKKIVSHDKEFIISKRSYPSGGALYPVEIYLYVQNIEGLDRGIYLFNPSHNTLHLVKKEEDLDLHINDLGISTDSKRNPLIAENNYEQAAVIFLLVANFEHQVDKYGLRAYRLALMESGHLSQNILLVSTYLKLKAIPFTGFYDDRINNFLGLDGKGKSILYMIPVG
ncbi:SagB/ThcOx family dehydrogenase [Bacillus wiedmannii]|uniref:SagB/ThcOx family dehydrogenase n=1 Tax=Bacillus wiedmannii TaxID=1890302 RepID=UPI003CEC169E